MPWKFIPSSFFTHCHWDAHEKQAITRHKPASEQFLGALTECQNPFTEPAVEYSTATITVDDDHNKWILSQGCDLDGQYSQNQYELLIETHLNSTIWYIFM